MASIAVTPFVVRDVTLTIDSDNYEASVSTVTFSPSTSTVTFKGLTPTSVFNFPTSPTWSVALTYAQDWDNEDSLSNYLLANAGSTVTAVFTPNAGGPSFTASVIIVPGDIGGAGDAVATASVTLPINGVPTKSA